MNDDMPVSKKLWNEVQGKVGEEMAPLIERLLHPSYTNPEPNNEGWVLEAVSVRRDMTAAAEEIKKLTGELVTAKQQLVFGSGGGVGGDVTVSVGGTQGGGFATAERGGRGGGGGVGPEGLNISNVKVGAPTHKDGHPIIKKVTPGSHDGVGMERRADFFDAPGPINYVVLASCDDSTSHKNNGEALTWGECIKAISQQLQKWIDGDGYNVQVIAVSATRDPVQHRRTSPV